MAPSGSPPFDPQLAEEFWRAFVTASGITLHVRQVTGKNTHHIVEASFKATARALRDAMRVEGGGVPSTKGTLGATGCDVDRSPSSTTASATWALPKRHSCTWGPTPGS